MDEITLQTHRYRLEGIAEEMGLVLQRTSFSPNIKERRDFSCAVVDRRGRLIAQAAHIPVHLGAIPVTMKHFLEEVKAVPGRGYLLNDPYQGGTHLPDLSYIEPWSQGGELRGYMINRAHHTDIGGARAGSMAACRHIDEEGFRTGPRWIATDGRLESERVRDFLDQTRNPEQRITDLEAQIAAARRGLQRMDQWADDLDVPPGEVFEGLLAYSRRFIDNLLDTVPTGTYSAEDRMDDDGIHDDPVTLSVELTVEADRILADYRETDDQVEGNINCPRSVVCSATYYVIQALLPEDIPINQGIFRPIDVRTRPGSLLEVQYPGPVAAGNVETSQRVVDLLLRAFSKALPERVPAASEGTMNNITIGWETGGTIRTYYETLGGGGGGGPTHRGVSGRQVHMTNTQNTPIEEFERHFPLLIEVLKLRRDSGGAGDHPGGEGLLKTWKALEPVDVGIVSERRTFPPYGLHGGSPGKVGENLVERGSKREQLPGKVNFHLEAGDRLRVQTPGGGGWNVPSDRRPR